MKKYFPMLIGNEETKDRLGKAIEAGTLPHAFLIGGPSGSGKSTLATEIAAAVNCEAKATGEKWLAGVENPDKESDTPYIAYLGIAGESVVTSGSYQRYYIVDGKSYHHIIDSETLFPSERFTSVSIVCKSSAMGDSLSTALFCMSLEDGMALVESLADVEALWIDNEGNEHRSSGFDSFVTEP